jgi:hypothetical protein
MSDSDDALPILQLEALRRYIEHGILPGHFLTAVLRNDLKEAVARADPVNQALLPVYVQWLYNRAPAACWGSPAQVAAWIST